MIFNFEKQVIDKILNLIKKHQVYLTKPENLPQLAKLGYMYNTLWYSGRRCWGHGGLISKSNQCEDNPKYKIEMCDPKTDEIDQLIYDAWGMHVDEKPISWEVFKQTILYNKTKELSELEMLQLKPQKTMQDWEQLMLHPDYRYKSIFPNQKQVRCYLLCSFGTGFGYEGGYVVEHASGADVDITAYGDWMNAKFSKPIQNVIDKLMLLPQMEQTVQTSYKHISKLVLVREAEKQKEQEEHLAIFIKLIEKIKENKPDEEITKIDQLIKNFGVMDTIHMLANELESKEEEKYKQYYPIREYSNITKFDEQTHPSYIRAGLEVCEEILSHYLEEKPENVEFAIGFIEGFDKSQVPLDLATKIQREAHRSRGTVQFNWDEKKYTCDVYGDIQRVFPNQKITRIETPSIRDAKFIDESGNIRGFFGMPMQP